MPVQMTWFEQEALGFDPRKAKANELWANHPVSSSHHIGDTAEVQIQKPHVISAELENELGIQLFERTKREVRLTDAGRIFVKEAKQALP